MQCFWLTLLLNKPCQGVSPKTASARAVHRWATLVCFRVTWHPLLAVSDYVLSSPARLKKLSCSPEAPELELSFLARRVLESRQTRSLTCRTGSRGLKELGLGLSFPQKGPHWTEAIPKREAEAGAGAEPRQMHTKLRGRFLLMVVFPLFLQAFVWCRDGDGCSPSGRCADPRASSTCNARRHQAAGFSEPCIHFFFLRPSTPSSSSRASHASPSASSRVSSPRVDAPCRADLEWSRVLSGV